MTFRSAERVEDSGGRQYHIGLAPGEVAPWIVLMGDPARVERGAARLDQVHLRRGNREYLAVTGTLGGLDITLMGTGIGADNTEIAVVELLNCMPRASFVRVGSCGALQPGIALGDLVVSTGAVRLESTSLGFVEEGYPAVAHYEMVLALATAAARTGHPHHLGLTATAAGFYGWQGRGEQVLRPRFPDLCADLAARGVLNLEMEASTLFTLATLAGVRAGAVCAVFASRPENRFIDPRDKAAAEDRALDVGLQGLQVLARMRASAGDGPFHLHGRSWETGDAGGR